MNLKFGKNQKIELISIIISVISIITGFILSLEYLSWIAVILCGIPIIKECAEGLIKEFDLTADLLVSMGIIASIIIGEVLRAEWHVLLQEFCLAGPARRSQRSLCLVLLPE